MMKQRGVWRERNLKFWQCAVYFKLRIADVDKIDTEQTFPFISR